jgi:hypothetical protein
MNVLRLAGIVTLVGLGAFMGIMFRRDRRQKAEASRHFHSQG